MAPNVRIDRQLPFHSHSSIWDFPLKFVFWTILTRGHVSGRSISELAWQARFFEQKVDAGADNSMYPEIVVQKSLTV